LLLSKERATHPDGLPKGALLGIVNLRYTLVRRSIVPSTA
jgi:hypothetical protein